MAVTFCHLGRSLDLSFCKMTPIKNFEDLEVWQIAIKLIKVVYQLLNTFPKDERFGIIAQGKDSVVSIAGNIAEGFGRYHYKDKQKFYYNSRGSLLETKSHLLTAEAVGFINKDNQELYNEAMKLIELEGVKLNNFIRSVGAKVTRKCH